MKKDKKYYVMPIDYSVAKEFIVKHHPKHNCGTSATFCYGLFKEDSNGLFGVGSSLEGVIMYSFPWGSRVKSSVFKGTFDYDVLELHRMSVQTSNNDYWCRYLLSKSIEFISESNKNIKCILIFDENDNNSVIYSLAGFLPYGKQTIGKKRFIKFLAETYAEELDIFDSFKYNISDLDIDVDTTLRCLKYIWENHKELKLGELLDINNLSNVGFINEIKNAYGMYTL